jgi:hypothetical protein
MLLRAPTHSRKRAKRDEKPANWLTAPRAKSLSSEGEAKKNSLKLNGRRGNVYENKGPPWKTRGRSWNVYENKGT